MSVTPDFQLIEFSLVPLEWVEAVYPPPSLVGRILEPCEHCEELLVKGREHLHDCGGNDEPR